VLILTINEPLPPGVAAHADESVTTNAHANETTGLQIELPTPGF
jgi:hypothetical protein